MSCPYIDLFAFSFLGRSCKGVTFFFFHKGVTPRGRVRALVSGGECKIMSRWRKIMSRWRWPSFHTLSLQAHLHLACSRAAAAWGVRRAAWASVASERAESAGRPRADPVPEPSSEVGGEAWLATLADSTLVWVAPPPAAAREQSKREQAWRERVRKEGQCRRDIICLQRDIILHSPPDTRALILPRGVTPLWKKKSVTPLQDLPKKEAEASFGALSSTLYPLP